jgi:hypothetical protein
MVSKKKMAGYGKIVDVKTIGGEGGAAISTIVERAHAKPAGMVVAVKTQQAKPWKEIDEQHFLWFSETDFSIHAIVVRPFRMEFHFAGGDVITYVPDMERRLDGAIEIDEIEKTQAQLADDPYYAWKVSLAREACQARGWTFRIITADKCVLPGRLLDNIRQVRLDSRMRVTSEDHLRLGEAMEKVRGKLTYGEAVAALSGHDDPWDRDGVAKLHALIVRRVVCVDLTRRLTQNSSVVLYRHPIWRPSQAT